MKRPLILFLLALVSAALVWRFGSLFDSDGSPTIAPVAPPSLGSEPVGRDLALAEDSAPTHTRALADEQPASTEDPAAAVGSRATGSLLLRAVSPEGEAVVGVTVYVTPKSGVRQGHGTTEHVTDEEGLARVTDLQPGRFTLYCPNGILRGADVRAGEETEVLLKFARLLEVHGIVRGPDGRPVPDADVWLLSWRRDWMGTVHTTRSGPNGEFVVTNVVAEKSLGATASGFGPSEPVDLEHVATESSPVEVELTLTALGGELTGRVLDPAGAPVVGALVAVGESPSHYSMRNDGTVTEAWCPRTVKTDASGAFAFVGLAAGTLPLHAVALDYPEYAGQVDIPVGGTTHTEVQLVRGMSVGGIARDEDGKAVADALVLALDAPFVDPFPTQGPTEPGVPFHRPATRTDDEGAFFLDRLPPGEAHLYASKGTSFWDDGNFVGTTQATLSGAAGETLEWNPVLSRGSRIHGRVMYADGKPMGNVFVSATDSEGGRFTEHAEEDGLFSIPGLENRAYKVSVQFWDPPEGARPLEQDDVWPAESELVLTANFEWVVLEKATARVRIDDRADRLKANGGVMFGHDRGAYFTDESDGVFSASLPPGRYQARAMDGDTVVGTSEWFELAPGEDRDLGSIVTRAAGSLIVRIRRPEELAESPVYVSLATDYEPRQGGHKFSESDELTFEDLLEGAVKLTIGGSNVAVESRRVPVRADSPTTVEFQLLPAELITLHVSAPSNEGFGKLEISIRHEDGEPYNTLEYYEIWGAKLPLDASTYLPKGRFVLTATTTSGLSASSELQVGGAETEASSTLDLQ